MPDRYADAVRRRRAELRSRRRTLPGHAAEVRTACALARVAASARSTTAITALSAELHAYLDRASRAERERLPELAAEAAHRIVVDVLAGTGRALVPELRRIATARGLPVKAAEGWSAGPVRVAVPPAPPPPSVWQAVATGGAVWRALLLPLAGLPVVGLPAVAGAAVPGPTAAWAGAGAGVVTLVVAAVGRRTVADRDRWRRWFPGVTAAMRAALDPALVTALLHTERQVTAAIDAAVVDRAAAIDEELRELTAAVPTGAASTRTGPTSDQESR